MENLLTLGRGSSHDGVRYGVGADIKKILFLEPLFQTFFDWYDFVTGWMFLTEYMKIGFYFTEPFSKDERKNIVHTGVSAEGQRVFDVSVNGEKIDRVIESG